MDFFEKVGSAISTVGKEVSKKAKDVADITNLNLQIKNTGDELEKLYAVLGKKYFSDNADKSEEEIGADYYDSIKIINIQIEKLNELKQELSAAKGTVKCEECGSEVPKGSTFCSSCGAKIKQSEADIFEDESQEVRNAIVVEAEVVGEAEKENETIEEI